MDFLDITDICQKIAEMLESFLTLIFQKHFLKVTFPKAYFYPRREI